MSKGCRLVVVALALTLVGAAPAKDGAANQEQAKAGNAAPKEPTPAPPAAPVLDVSPPPDRGCEYGKDDRKSDLCAQWKAADAAYDAALWAWWQLILGGAGLALGAATMAAAIAAAVYAKRAAVATEATVEIARSAASEAGDALAIANRNAKAAASSAVVARKGLEHAQLASRNQLRAYLYLETAYLDIHLPKIKGEPLPGTADIQLSFRNFGQTPATEVTMAVEACIHPPPFHQVFNHVAGIFQRSGDMAHRMTAGQIIELKDFAAQRPAIDAGAMALYVYGRVTYRDMFGEQHITDFRWFMTGAKEIEAKRFRVAPEGNKAT